MMMGGCMKDLQAMRGLFPKFDKDIDCPQWLAEEQEYLSSLQHEPKSEALKIEYLEAIKACGVDTPEFFIDPPSTILIPQLLLEFPQTTLAPSNLNQIG